jgi:hypothetical protein
MIQRELVDNKHPEETMHQVGTELKQIYPASASGRRRRHTWQQKP